jgi:two-component system, response regulator PdtaR
VTEGRVLIVEDESIVALQVRRALEQRGLDVTDTCATGHDAIASLAEKPADLVLMDVRLQGPLDGIETAAAIRASSHVPIVFLTANSDDDTLRRARITDPYGYLLKPFNSKELGIAVDMALFKHHLDEEKRHLTERLENALERVKLLSGFLPTCAHCKRIRDQDGHWAPMEEYIHEHSEAEFSHGICPECSNRFYPEDTAER